MAVMLCLFVLRCFESEAVIFVIVANYVWPEVMHSDKKMQRSLKLMQSSPQVFEKGNLIVLVQ